MGRSSIKRQEGPVDRGRAAVEAAVVADLRAALADPHIGAVILHVNSRGGSVTASDGIYAAVRRLNQEKPVIACFGEVAASGGYYVACGARAIVASPLTVTGSIGVFAMFPTWPGLTERLSIQHDVIKNRSHAALYDPWGGFDDEARALADREVGAMYEDFLNLVATARHKTRDEIHAVAEGRVWIGADALRVGLVDGLGGMTEASERARKAYGKPLADEMVLVKARGHETRPLPFRPEKAAQLALPLEWLEAWSGPDASLDVLQELASLLRGRGPRPITLAYWPWSWR
jgi:protease-4